MKLAPAMMRGIERVQEGGLECIEEAANEKGMLHTLLYRYTQRDKRHCASMYEIGSESRGHDVVINGY